MNHLETNKILAAEQLDFRPTSSTELALFYFINNILNQFQIKIMLEASSLTYKRPSTA